MLAELGDISALASSDVRRKRRVRRSGLTVKVGVTSDTSWLPSDNNLCIRMQDPVVLPKSHGRR